MVIHRGDMLDDEPANSRKIDPRLLDAEGVMRVVLAFKLSVACKACRTVLPVHSMDSLTLACPACGEEVSAGRKAWRKVFDESTVIRGFCWPQKTMGAHDAKDGGLHGTYGRRPIRCAACKTQIEDTQLDELARGESVACRECHETLPARPANKTARQLCPCAITIVGEGQYSAADPDKLEAMHCPSCGSALQVDGRSRIVNCEYCKSSAQIPDSVWLKLHPGQIAREIYLIADMDEELRWSWLLRNPDQAESVLSAGTKLPPSALEGMSRSGSMKARRLGARNIASTEQQLDRLSRDKYESEVRAAVAHNPSVGTETLARLLDDHSDEVQRAAFGNPRFTLEDFMAVILEGDYLMWRIVAERGDLADLDDAALNTLLDHASTEFLDTIASNKILSAERLLRIREPKPLDPVMLSLAERVAELPADAAKALAQNEDAAIRHTVAANPSAPPSILQILAKDKEPEVAKAARENQSFRPTLLQKMGIWL